MSNEFSSLVEAKDLRDIIRGFKLDNPSASTSSLARSIGIPQSNLSKIENLQRNATLEEVVKILVGTGNDELVPRVLAGISNEAKEAYLRNTVESDRTFVDKRVLPLFDNELTFQLMVYLFTLETCPVEKIKDIFGTIGINTMNDLIDEGLFSLNDGVIIVNNEGVKLSAVVLKKILINSIQSSYDYTKFGSGKNWLSYRSLKVHGPSALKYINSKFNKLYDEIYKELCTEKYEGDDVIFYGMCSDNILGNNQNTKDGVL